MNRMNLGTSWQMTVMLSALLVAGSASADEPAFSGPQKGEKLVPFNVKGVYDEDAGKPLDFVKQADGKPTVLVFVHKVTRPSVGLTRVLMDYVATRKKDGLRGFVVWLADDATASEAFLKRARHAIPKKTPIGISVDGQEGPGAYGLNRNVTLTILTANDNKVTANFALVQPSLQADLLKIVGEVVKLVGGETPTLAELGAVRRPKAKPSVKPAKGPQLAPQVEGRLRRMIQKDATAEQVDKVAAEIEAALVKDEASRQRVGEIARNIIKAGKLDNYGTPKAREYLQAWAKKFVPTQDTQKRAGDSKSRKSASKPSSNRRSE